MWSVELKRAEFFIRYKTSPHQQHKSFAQALTMCNVQCILCSCLFLKDKQLFRGGRLGKLFA